MPDITAADTVKHAGRINDVHAGETGYVTARRQACGWNQSASDGMGVSISRENDFRSARAPPLKTRHSTLFLPNAE
jgi:hypothetical protein